MPRTKYLACDLLDTVVVLVDLMGELRGELLFDPEGVLGWGTGVSGEIEERQGEPERVQHHERVLVGNEVVKRRWESSI